MPTETRPAERSKTNKALRDEVKELKEDVLFLEKQIKKLGVERKQLTQIGIDKQKTIDDFKTENTMG